MARVGFFQMLLDDNMSVGEMNAINRAGDRADAAMEQGAMLGSQIGVLHGRLAAQSREIKQLRALIGVLAGVLRDTGVVDAQVLDYRLEAALEDVAEQAAAPALVTCVRCGRQFPQNQTNVTELGTCCDRCAAGV